MKYGPIITHVWQVIFPAILPFRGRPRLEWPHLVTSAQFSWKWYNSTWHLAFQTNLRGILHNLINPLHDDIMAWNCSPHYLPFVRVIKWPRVDYPHKGQQCRTFLICCPEQAVEQPWSCQWSGTRTWINIGSGNGLVLSGNKPLPEPMLTNYQWSLVAFTWEQFHGKYVRYLS